MLRNGSEPLLSATLIADIDVFHDAMNGIPAETVRDLNGTGSLVLTGVDEARSGIAEFLIGPIDGGLNQQPVAGQNRWTLVLDRLHGPIFACPAAAKEHL